MKGYADDGKIRIYHKDFLYPDDISDKTAIYNRSKMFYCVGLSDSRHYWDYYPLFFTTSSDFLELDQNTYSKEEFIDCISSVPEVLTRSAHEVFLYGLNAEPTLFIGIDGKDNAIISGIPSEDRLRREIRMKEIYIGTE